MVLNKDKNLKIYYSIKEVAQMLGVAESTLRFWESEFPQIKPKTARGTGIRQYTEKDIEQLKVIYNLVKVRGFKIAAARKMLFFIICQPPCHICKNIIFRNAREIFICRNQSLSSVS